MNYNTKSIIIGRKKREKKEDLSYPCFVSLFSINNPHTSGKVPDEILEFPRIHKVVITGLDVDYLLAGNDLVINNLTQVEVSHEKGHIHITGKQHKP